MISVLNLDLYCEILRLCSIHDSISLLKISRWLYFEVTFWRIILRDISKTGPLACSSRIDILSIPGSGLRSIVLRTVSLNSNLSSEYARYKSTQTLIVSKGEFVHELIPGEEILLTYISSPGATEAKILCWDLKYCREADTVTVPGYIFSRYTQPAGGNFKSGKYYSCFVVVWPTGTESQATNHFELVICEVDLIGRWMDLRATIPIRCEWLDDERILPWQISITTDSINLLVRERHNGPGPLKLNVSKLPVDQIDTVQEILVQEYILERPADGVIGDLAFSFKDSQVLVLATLNMSSNAFPYPSARLLYARLYPNPGPRAGSRTTPFHYFPGRFPLSTISLFPDTSRGVVLLLRSSWENRDHMYELHPCSDPNEPEPSLALKLLPDGGLQGHRFPMFPLYSPLGLQRLFVANNHSLPIQYMLQSYDIGSSRSVMSRLEFPSIFEIQSWWHRRRDPCDFYNMDFRLGIVVTKLDVETAGGDAKLAIVRY